MAYKPIESYGVIGDLHTVALVGMDGSIDWCCLPQFDSPSIFAAILDEHKGGFFKIASLYEAQHKQMYLPDSNVLVTRFLSPEGVGEVVDFMPVQDPSRGKKTHQSFASCGPCAGPCASGSNANPLSTTRGGRIRSLWKDAARCLRRPACVSRC
jgi:Glucoamylase and related glycosyl hydrolases